MNTSKLPAIVCISDIDYEFGIEEEMLKKFQETPEATEIKRLHGPHPGFEVSRDLRELENMIKIAQGYWEGVQLKKKQAKARETLFLYCYTLQDMVKKLKDRLNEDILFYDVMK